jgi:glucosylceramidase
MKRHLSRIFAFTFTAVLVAACAPAPTRSSPAVTLARVERTTSPLWLVSTEAAPFARMAPPASEAPGAIELRLRADEARHAVEGFGGAFNEHGWDVLGQLSETERRGVLEALFDRGTGLGLRYGRIPIGASDYALDRYTHDEAPDDFEMKKFSIDRDRRLLIPFIQAARAIRPDLVFWASAWTPPTWMKTNGAFDSGDLEDDPRVYAAYALYLARFVESYREEGIEISMVVPQNEPGQLTRYPSCGWTPAQYVTFIRDHLGPTLRRRAPSTQIFVGTINRGDWDVLSVLEDASVSPFIAGVALQWGGLAHVEPVHAAFPGLPIMQSETECGNGRKEPDYNPETPPNDFAYAAHTFRKMRDFIGGGASSYMLWNVVLDEHGKNIDSERPWPQNSPIVVNRRAKRVIFTPMYSAVKHFSALLDRGARVVPTESAFSDQIAFANPDGSLVIELMNASEATLPLRVVVREEAFPIELPARSFASLVLPAKPNGNAPPTRR